MKFEVSSAALLKGVDQVWAAVPPGRAVIPACENIQFAVSDDFATLAATNLAVFITALVPIKLEGGGFSASIPAKALKDLLSTMPDQPLVIELNGFTMTVSSGFGTYTIACEDPADFPSLPAFPQSNIKVPAKRLSTALGHASTFTADDDQKGAALQGVLVQATGENLDVVACDKYALIRFRYKSDGDPIHAVIPKANVPPVKSAISGSTDDAWLSTDESFIFVVSGGVKVAARLMVDKYPDYERILPKNDNTVATVDRTDLLGCLGRASVCTDEYGHVLFGFSHEGISTLAQNGMIHRKAEEMVKAEMKGRPVKMEFTIDLIARVARIAPSVELKIVIDQPTWGARILPAVTDPEEEFLGMVQPVTRTE